MKVCSVHGPRGGERCDACEEPLLDLGDTADREFLRDLFGQQRSARWNRAALYSVPILMLATWASFKLGVEEPLRYPAIAVPYLAAMALVELILRAELPASQRKLMRRVFAFRPGRLLLSVPVLAALAIVVVQLLVTGGIAGAIFADNPLALPMGAPALEFAMVPSHVAQGQDLWSVGSAALLHADLPHLAGNVLGLLIFGQALDLRVGRARTALVLILGVLLGNFAFAALHPHLHAPTVGISAGVYALLGAQLAVLPRRPVFLSLAGSVVEVPNWVALPMLTVVYALIDAVSNPHVAWEGHIAGALVGLTIGLAFRRIPEPRAYAEAEELRLMRSMAGV